MSSAEIIAFGALLSLVSFAGGALLVIPRRLHGRAVLMHHLAALGAGFMLTALFMEILPEALSGWIGDTRAPNSNHRVATALSLVLCGYLTVHVCEHVFALHTRTISLRGDTPTELLPATTVYAALFGLTVHTFFDGVTIATGFLVDLRFGLLVFAAVLLHKIPEGMTTASIMLAGEHSPREALVATAVVALATLVGVLAVTLLPFDTSTIIRYALPFAAGVTLYIAASDLIPEIVHRRGHHPLAPLAVLAGVALFYILNSLIRH